MCITYILGLFLILLIATVIFILSCNNQIVTLEKWSNLESDSCSNNDVSPMYAGCDGFNCPLDKRKTKRAFYDDGYKMEDDRYQCLCKCTRKCSPTPNPTPDEKKETKSRMGERLPFYPWFSPKPHF
jgi:hypothetical protein